MPLPIGISAKAKAEHLLYSNWKPSAVAQELSSTDTLKKHMLPSLAKSSSGAIL